MKKLIMLTLTLAFISFTAIAGTPDPPTRYCSCEACAADGEQACEEYWTGLLRICGGYYALYCQ